MTSFPTSTFRPLVLSNGLPAQLPSGSTVPTDALPHSNESLAVPLQGDGATALVPPWDYSSPTTYGSVSGSGVGGNPFQVDFSPDGRFVAAASPAGTNPAAVIYEVSSSGLTVVADLTSAIGTTPIIRGVKWHPSGRYVVFTGATFTTSGATVFVFERVGTSFFFVSSPASDPGFSALMRTGFSWTPDGRFLAVRMPSSPWMMWYEFQSGILTKMADPATNLGASHSGISWSPDGLLLAVCNATTSPAAMVYQRVGKTLVTTGVTGFNTQPNAPVAVAFSPDGSMLAFAGNTGVNFSVYTRSGTSFTQAQTVTLPSSTCNFLSWSPDGRYLICGQPATGAPFVVCQRTGNTLTQLSAPTDANAIGVIMGAWSPDQRFIATCFSNSPYITLLQTSSPEPSGKRVWDVQRPAARLVGEIRVFGTTTAPAGWAVCDGSAVSRTTYAELFAIIGTTYGTGDGSTTFNLPSITAPLTGTKYIIAVLP